MANVLIADTLEGSASVARILKGHDLVIVSTLKAAQATLEEKTYDLIVAALHFDDSRMFELIRVVRKNPRNSLKPIICFCSRETHMAKLMHESLEVTTRALGAWMYLSEHAYNVYQDPDAELRRVMERCLTEEARKEILQQRVGIQKQREAIQKLRVMLEAQEWSPGLKGYLVELGHELELLLDQVRKLQESTKDQRASVESSRDLKDRVSEHVTLNENGMTQQEENQSIEESTQDTSEKELAKKVALKQEVAQRKLDTH